MTDKELDAKINQRIDFIAQIFRFKDIEITFDPNTSSIIICVGEDGVQFRAEDCKMVWGILARLDTQLSLAGIVT
jgi:hypothetical protein